MTLVEKLFALRSRSPFDRLDDNELALIAEVATPKTFPANEKIAQAGTPLQRLYVVLEGEIRCKGLRMPQVFGAPSLLFELPLSAELYAGAQGVSCLLIGKGHFYTLVHECPSVVVAFMWEPDLRDSSVGRER